MNFDGWIKKMKSIGKKPFGTAYEIFAKEAWDSATLNEREECALLIEYLYSRKVDCSKFAEKIRNRNIVKDNIV